jgi:hypothetical protein
MGLSISVYDSVLGYNLSLCEKRKGNWVTLIFCRIKTGLFYHMDLVRNTVALILEKVRHTTVLFL